MTSLWLLDFDACRKITLNEEGVDKARKDGIETRLDEVFSIEDILDMDTESTKLRTLVRHC